MRGELACPTHIALVPAAETLVPGPTQPRPHVCLRLQVGAALLTLFITSTLDGYTPTMYMTMATR